MEIQLVKLVSGEQFIAYTEYSAEEKGYRVKTPVVFQATPEGIVGRPWLIYDNGGDFLLKDEHVLCITGVEDNFLQGYRENFGSGIVTPPKNLVI